MKTVYVKTDRLPRQAMIIMPDGLELIYTKATGWQLWFHAHDDEAGGLKSALLAEENAMPGDGKGLRVDIDGFVICDSLHYTH
ncbi:hypothetical protein EVC30_119 [Rhizobium phage RHph_Y1_11]|nr:hypothetical protein EVC30_119 [Rhizobium phage RHph_Y1_11]